MTKLKRVIAMILTVSGLLSAYVGNDAIKRQMTDDAIVGFGTGAVLLILGIFFSKN